MQRLLERLASFGTSRPRLTLAVFAVLALASAGVALGLQPSANLDTFVSSSSPDYQATQLDYREFGGSAVEVLVREPLLDLIGSRDLGVLSELEACLAGQQVTASSSLGAFVPVAAQRAKPFGGSTSPCGHLMATRPAQVVYGPATFLNQAVIAVNKQIGTLLDNVKTSVKSVEAKVLAAAKARGLSVEQQREDAQTAGTLEGEDQEEKYYELALNSGLGSLTSLPSIDNTSFIESIVFDATRGAYTPKARFSYLFPTSKSALIQVRLKPGLTTAQTSAAIHWIRAATQMKMFALGTHGSYLVSGEPVFINDVSASLSGQVALLLVGAVIVMAVVLLLVFRQRRRLLPLALALAAAGITFGLCAVAGGTLTMASIAVLPILIGLAVDYGIQFQSRASGATTIAAAALATATGFVVLLLSPVPMVQGFGLLLVLGVGVAFVVVLCAGSAALALPSLMVVLPDPVAASLLGAGELVSAPARGAGRLLARPLRGSGHLQIRRLRGAGHLQIRRLRGAGHLLTRPFRGAGRRLAGPVREAGQLLGGAVRGAAQLISSAVHAAGRPRRGRAPARPVSRRPAPSVGPSGQTRLAATLSAVSRRPRTVLAVGLALALVGWFADTQTSVQSDVTKLVPANLPALRNLTTLERVTGESGELDVLVHAKDVATPATIAWMDRYETQITQHFGYVEAKGCLAAHVTVCPALSLPDLFSGSTGSSSGSSSASLSQSQITGLLDAVPAYFSQAVINRSRTYAALSFGIRLMPLSEQIRLVAYMRDHLDPPAGDTARLAGLPVLVADADASLSSSSRRLLTVLAALGAVALMLMAIFRRPRRALTPLVPIVLATGWSALIVWLIGIPLNPMSATLGALVIAISTEFSVLLSERFRRQRAAGESADTALLNAYRSTGKAVIASGITAIAGFAVLIVSNVTMLSDFGVVTLIDMTVSLLGVLAVLPSVLKLSEGDAATVTLPAAGRRRPLRSGRPRPSSGRFELPRPGLRRPPRLPRPGLPRPPRLPRPGLPRPPRLRRPRRQVPA